MSFYRVRLVLLVCIALTTWQKAEDYAYYSHIHFISMWNYLKQSFTSLSKELINKGYEALMVW